mmetsp:Transcript_17931/g.63285  ORF Transcript_17931/g.63285 Transcript_17931/m.63285 type:complete len:423 (+) Transcript_17931:4020-5288(+)
MPPARMCGSRTFLRIALRSLLTLEVNLSTLVLVGAGNFHTLMDANAADSRSRIWLRVATSSLCLFLRSCAKMASLRSDVLPLRWSESRKTICRWPNMLGSASSSPSLPTSSSSSSSALMRLAALRKTCSCCRTRSLFISRVLKSTTRDVSSTGAINLASYVSLWSPWPSASAKAMSGADAASAWSSSLSSSESLSPPQRSTSSARVNTVREMSIPVVHGLNELETVKMPVFVAVARWFMIVDLPDRAGPKMETRLVGCRARVRVAHRMPSTFSTRKVDASDRLAASAETHLTESVPPASPPSASSEYSPSLSSSNAPRVFFLFFLRRLGARFSVGGVSAAADAGLGTSTRRGDGAIPPLLSPAVCPPAPPRAGLRACGGDGGVTERTGCSLASERPGSPVSLAPEDGVVAASAVAPPAAARR